MTDNENKNRTVYLIYHEGSEVGKDCYVGSTSQSLKKRLGEHRSVASQPGNEKNKLYRRMREVGWENWVIRPLETMTCSEDEIRKLERMWFEELRSDLNSKLPIRFGKKKRGPTMQTVYMIYNKNSKNGKDSYVGSTSQCLERRLSDHKSHAKQKQNEKNKFYRRMLEVGLENWEIVPLLTLECTRDEIRAFEQEWADLLEADLNSNLPMTTAEEKREAANRRGVKHYANNLKEVLLRKAEYRAKNREVLRRKAVERRAKDREQKKFFCEACEISLGGDWKLKRHTDTLKHQYAFLNSLE